ncbi:MAG: hypothetical protein JSR91_05070 [Proteobacteria bacterium]|nr:hypothetical protein [Pseudomonadota bacterium]
MRHVLAVTATLLLSGLPAHAQQQPVQPQQPIGGWASQNSPQPRLGDMQDCRAEARRQAEMRYPPQRIVNRGREVTFENPQQFPAETSFFGDCMRRKGF